MCDQGLGRGQLQLEVLTQEPPHRILDLLGLPPGTSEAQQPVVGVTAIAQPPVAGIVGVPGRHGLHLPAQLPTTGPIPTPFPLPRPAPQPHVRTKWCASVSLVIGREQSLFDVGVQSVQVDIREDG
jgi:hypothetical protein